MRIRIANAVVAATAAFLLWLLLALGVVGDASGQEVLKAQRQQLNDRNCVEVLDTQWKTENHVDNSTYVCGLRYVVAPRQVQATLTLFMPGVMDCLRGHGETFNPAYIAGLKVKVVQEIVVLPNSGGVMFIGYTDFSTNTIYIRETLPSYYHPYNVFKHELIHVLTRKADHDKQPYERCSGVR